MNLGGGGGNRNGGVEFSGGTLVAAVGKNFDYRYFDNPVALWIDSGCLQVKKYYWSGQMQFFKHNGSTPVLLFLSNNVFFLKLYCLKIIIFADIFSTLLTQSRSFGI